MIAPAASVSVSSLPKRGASTWRHAQPGRSPRADAAAAGHELADRLVEPTRLHGPSSSPRRASPSTNGSRMKLVTSSRAIVRAALKVAGRERRQIEPATARADRARAGARAPPASASPAAKAPMIAAYARYGGGAVGRSVTTSMEATLGRSGRVQNNRRLSADRRPADGGRDPGRRAEGRRALPDAARRDRHRQDGDDGMDDRAGRPARRS